jgi:hypothetical protein
MKALTEMAKALAVWTTHYSRPLQARNAHPSGSQVRRCRPTDQKFANAGDAFIRAA